MLQFLYPTWQISPDVWTTLVYKGSRIYYKYCRVGIAWKSNKCSKKFIWTIEQLNNWTSIQLWRLCEGCVKIVWRLCEDCVKIVWKLCENCVKIVWRLCENCVKILHISITYLSHNRQAEKGGYTAPVVHFVLFYLV